MHGTLKRVEEELLQKKVLRIIYGGLNIKLQLIYEVAGVIKFVKLLLI